MRVASVTGKSVYIL